MDEFFMHSTMKAVRRMFSAWRRFFFSVFSGCNNFALRHFELRGQPYPAARSVARRA